VLQTNIASFFRSEAWMLVRMAVIASARRPNSIGSGKAVAANTTAENSAPTTEPMPKYAIGARPNQNAYEPAHPEDQRVRQARPLLLTGVYSSQSTDAQSATQTPFMETPTTTVRAAETFGRTRLSKSFFMRDFLYSEIAAIHGMANLPDDPDLAIAAGSRLCEMLLEPLQATFGRVAVRSAYRSPEVNAYGARHRLSCASNEKNRARHIWDRRSRDGMGALTCIVIPWFVERMAEGASWHAMAWWIHDHLPYSELQFFPRLGAFNIGWHEVPKRTIYSFIPPRGFLTRPGLPNHTGDHSRSYRGFPKLKRSGSRD